MNPYEVQDYRKAILYRVTPPDLDHKENIETIFCANNKEAFQRSAGYGGWVRIGVLQNVRRLFVSLFTDGETLFFRFGDRMYDCLAGRVEAERESVAPGVKRFRFSANGHIEFEEQYLWIDWATWPDSGDILEHVQRIVQSPTSMYFLVLLRKAAQQGRSVGTAEVAEDLRHQAEEMARLHGPKRAT